LPKFGPLLLRRPQSKFVNVFGKGSKMRQPPSILRVSAKQKPALPERAPCGGDHGAIALYLRGVYDVKIIDNHPNQTLLLHIEAVEVAKWRQAL
jgi:hypothetical protein